jgi:hypothetical protein
MHVHGRGVEIARVAREVEIQQRSKDRDAHCDSRVFRIDAVERADQNTSPARGRVKARNHASWNPILPNGHARSDALPR